ncbi:zinc finger matrin-type protein 1-like isoform X2 [Sphaerodactylus townsendi]|nr:zinc finger matrin-type protein 1-like isoform X2 [Sphaerodactylus townsendi]
MAAAASPSRGPERAGGGQAEAEPPVPRGQREDETLDETTRKKLCKDTFCEVCGAVLQFESQRISHYEGKKHAQKVRLYLQMHSEQEEGQEPGKQKKQYVNFQTDPNVDKNKYCRLCNMIFTSPIVAESHYLGKIHAKKLKQLSAQQDQHSAHSTQPELGLSLTSAVLEICHEKTSQDTDAKDLSFSSSVPFNLDNPEKYCKLCLAPFNNPLMARQHYVGKKHKRNEARQKLMAEIGPEGIPGESKASVGAGNYICPICSISLTSLEMYQSHMKGNKHHMKEAMIDSLMKKAKKTYHSFQDELTDYINVQKARGLEPKTNFRKSEEEFQREEFEALDCQEETAGFDQDPFSHGMYELGQHSIFADEAYAPPYIVEKRLPCRSPALENPLKLDNIERCLEKQVSQLTVCKRNANDWSSDERVTFFDRSLSYSRESQKTKKNKKEYAGDREEIPSQHLQKPKRKWYHKEETYLKKGSEKQKQRQDAAVSTEWKSKHGKGKRNKGVFSEKESKKHKKARKEAKVGGPIDEEILWNESVLGF